MFQKAVICFFIYFFSLFLFSCSDSSFEVLSVSDTGEEEEGIRRRRRRDRDKKDSEGSEKCIESYNICDRTRQVKEHIMSQLKKQDCREVTKEDLKSITKLSITYREDLTTLKSGDFFGLTSVEILFLSFNQLERLSKCVFVGLDSVQKIYLGNNRLRSLPEGLFFYTQNLKEVYMELNILEDLPDGLLEGPEALKGFYAGNNHLKELPDSFFYEQRSSLEVIDLCHNNFKSVRTEMFSEINTLRTLILVSNPLSDAEKAVIKRELGQRMSVKL